jgi:GTP-binding protein YchF
MQIGIVGLPFSGKTTLFDTLLKHKVHDIGKKLKSEAERGVVTVPDDRLGYLSQLFNPKKSSQATIEYIKVPGLDKVAHQKGALPSQFLANLKNVDVLLVMLRDFENEVYPHPRGKVDPLSDKRFIESEFLLNDLAIIENRLEKLEKLVMKTQGEDEKKQLAVLRKCLTHLEQEQPLRTLELDAAEKLSIRGYQFLSEKPLLFVINISEDKIQQMQYISEKWREDISPFCSVIALSAEIESEIAELEPADAKLFLQDLHITEPALFKVIHASYDLLGLASFFTVSESECRAWTFKRGINAQTAAGLIHTDMQKGFIRAEVVSVETLKENGSMNACKEKGVLRLEGKEYIVQDGDILTIRFNI